MEKQKKKVVEVMTTWEYRVVRHTCKEDRFLWFAVYEVYSNGGKLSWTVDHKAPIGDSVDELRADLKMMLKACDRPVLEEKNGTLVEVER